MIIEKSEEKVNKVLESLDKKSQEKEPAAVPYSLHKEELDRLETINQRLCKLALAGWGVSVLYVLIDIVSKVITK